MSLTEIYDKAAHSVEQDQTADFQAGIHCRTKVVPTTIEALGILEGL